MKKILAGLIFLILPIISFADEIFIPVELWLGEDISQTEKIGIAVAKAPQDIFLFPVPCSLFP